MICLRQPPHPRWCALRSAGGPSHTAACGARFAAGTPVLITADPKPDTVCEACRLSELRELEAIADVCRDMNGQPFADLVAEVECKRAEVGIDCGCCRSTCSRCYP